MRLLFLTQKVDSGDNVLGFVHGWLVAFAHTFESVTAIALGVGGYQVPRNVRIFSLGKEKGNSRIGYVIRFYTYVWRERDNYDQVFVHMNKEYVILGALLWKMMGKKVIFWYNHPIATITARIAARLADVVLYTSPQSFFAQHSTAIKMPVGVDTHIFQNSRQLPASNTLLVLGRVAPVKDTATIIEAANTLHDQSIDFKLSVVGDASAKDAAYYHRVCMLAKPLIEAKKARFFDAVANSETPILYNSNAVYLNLTKGGSFDKTIFEAMACERLIITSNPGLASMLPEEYRSLFICQEHDVSDLAKRMKKVLELPSLLRVGVGKQFRDLVIKDHSLDALCEKLLRVCERLRK